MLEVNNANALRAQVRNALDIARRLGPEKQIDTILRKGEQHLNEIKQHDAAFGAYVEQQLQNLRDNRAEAELLIANLILAEYANKERNRRG